MKPLKTGILFLVTLLLLASCSEDMDDVPQSASSLAIKDFIWKAMNAFYLYKSDVAALEDNRFNTNSELETFLNTFPSPEALYDGIQSDQDDFSFITANYVELEQLFSGVSTSNGMEFGLHKYPDGSDNVYGSVRLVLPDTDAENKAIARGMLFNTINNQQLTLANFSELIELKSYTIGLATRDDEVIAPTGEFIALTKQEYTENPIFKEEVITRDGKKIGYLMYTGFVSDFDPQLNAVFGRFKAEAIDELVLDLRYNGGGSVRSAIDLSAMITGQFTGEVFSTENWNADIQEVLAANDPDRLVNLFNNRLKDGTTMINSLELTKVYILAIGSSASASELVINGLNPYIDVIHIGDSTRGKFQASVTLYDSPNFFKSNINRNHTYAIQPLVLKSANKLGFTDYIDGLTPDITLKEDVTNMGVLGDPEEPLLKAAIDLITTGMKPAQQKNAYPVAIPVGESRMLLPNYQRMYL